MQPVNPPLVVKMSPVRPPCCPCPCCCGGCPCCCGCPCCGGKRRRRSLRFLQKQVKPFGASRATRFCPL
ncbi:unnamed protein product [Bursaphelenchus okinawaensis]|uniref:Uncharacterized protein n=1 Tax=Bursaphelenchus okinawaensis TaxID=465554 RepID=A0A811KRT2_9BILA|nr:unnamed protein product [Bursaphelenchus okinawaensis]CAG9112007.1 unnamed protein product [Bursaphelenchus okinawaensis]